MTTVYLTSIDAEQSHNLDEMIKLALEKTGVQKELDLCAYIPSRNGPLSSSTYLRLRDADQETLCRLIKQHILGIDPRKVPIPSGTSHSEQSYSGMPLQECVRQAMAKLNVRKESALCRYIPYGEGYIHHFTYFKMKSANPVQTRNLIQRYILDERWPKRVPHKPRKKHRHIRSSTNDAACVADQSAADFRSEMERLSSRLLMGVGEEKVAKNSENGRVDQILRVMQQLTEVIISHKSYNGKHEGLRSSIERSSNLHVENSLLFLQRELVMKIMKGEADHSLWYIFAELTK